MGGVIVREVDLLIIGAGPAGLSAAIQAGGHGISTLVVDENSKPGGQLFKQIHKFFGSEAHNAGTRGFKIGEILVHKIENNKNIELWLDSIVYGAIDSHHIEVVHKGKVQVVCCRNLLVATGAIEKGLCFPGWTLPGVMGAGALQTMININRVLPGKKMLMVGSGNVGLIVSYQFMQAGGEVVALVDAAAHIGGYGVHASKISRYGAKILTGTTVKKASGNEAVERAILTKVDKAFHPVEDSEWQVETDIIAIAAGLFPLTEMLRLLGCRFAMDFRLGGWIPLHNDRMETSVAGVYIAGDVSGIEEASTAMEEGRLAALSIARSQEKISASEFDNLRCEVQERLDDLRSGPFGLARREAKSALFQKNSISCSHFEVYGNVR